MSFSRALFELCAFSCFATPAYADHSGIGFGGDGAGPITTIAADTLPQGKLALGLTSEFIKTEAFSDAELAAFASDHVHAHSVDWTLTNSLSIGYGVSDTLSLTLRIPHLHRDSVRSASHVHGGGGLVINSAENHGDSTGFGDMAVLARYRFWKNGDHRAALLLGAKLPTGRTDVRNSNERLEVEHQPGSGSWDGLAGFAAGTRAGSVALDANALYQLAGEGAQDTDLGDRLQYNLAASYRIGGEAHDHGDRIHHHRALDLVLELNGEWADRKEVAGEEDDHSGGTTIFLSPGFRYAPDEKFSAHVSIGIPVASDIGDGHADTDYKLTFGLSRAF
jgi:hypothetical protein